MHNAENVWIFYKAKYSFCQIDFLLRLQCHDIITAWEFPVSCQIKIEQHFAFFRYFIGSLLDLNLLKVIDQLDQVLHV